MNRREKDIVRLITRGLINKEIADELKLALITVKVYRGQAMKKPGTGNPAEMVKVALLGGLEIENPGNSRFEGEAHGDPNGLMWLFVFGGALFVGAPWAGYPGSCSNFWGLPFSSPPPC